MSKGNLSRTENQGAPQLSFEAYNISRERYIIEFDYKLGRIPVGRSDFYGFRRKFYHNLDVLLKE